MGNKGRVHNGLMLFFGLPLLLGIWLLVSNTQSNSFTAQLKSLAGVNAIDCGVFSEGTEQDLTRVQQTAVRAFRKKQPFYYCIVAPDGAWLGTIYNPRRGLFLVVSRAPGLGQGNGQIASQYQCLQPKIVRLSNGLEVLTYKKPPKPVSLAAITGQETG